ncbi:MAG: HAMP domain-containing histidine kinase [Treponemataceae bacterium]|nr:HAMP domain-containing histidine kinase [Treponemataceae bacterium]
MRREQLIDYFLGPPALGPLTPQRLRDETFVLLLLTILPLMIISAIVEYFVFPNVFVVINGVLAFDGLCSLWLIKKKVPAAPLFFLGGALFLVGFCYFFLLFKDPPLAYQLHSFVVLVYFGVLLLDGLYSLWNGSATAIYMLILFFDCFSWFFNPHRQEIIVINTWFSIGALHTLGFAVNLFIRSYYHRLEQIALARKIMNQRLEELLKEVRESGLQRLASFSHDIRSPLTSIMAVQAMLAATDLTEEQKRYVDILGRSNKLVLDLIESVLNPGSYKPGSYKNEEYYLYELVEELLAPQRPLMALRNIRLINRVPRKIPFPSIDTSELVRILSNLIDNGLKYSGAGELCVGAEERKQNGVDVIRMWVEDSGPGFSADTIAAIRENRVTPDAQFSSSYALGLRGVIELLQSNKGKIWIENRPHGGGRVIFELPSTG